LFKKGTKWFGISDRQYPQYSKRILL